MPINPAFLVAAIMSGFMAYLAIIDPNVRTAFSSLASSAITGYFSLTSPQSTKPKDDGSPKQD